MVAKNGCQRKSQKVWMLFSWLIIATLLLSGCGNAGKSKVYKVGVLSGLDAFANSVDGFKAKMTELGYIEGQNITYDLQSTNVDIDAYKNITKKFVEDKVDLIFVFPTEAAMEAKAATQSTNIPVVFGMASTDSPGVNLINSAREPGGNITGVQFTTTDIAAKRFQILIELVPSAKRIFVPYLNGYPNVPSQLDAVRPLAQSLGAELIEFGSTSPQDLQSELNGFIASDNSVGIDAILLLAEPLSITPDFYAVLGKFSYDHKIPLGGSLMSIDGKYSSIFALIPDTKGVGADAALLADKIFKGTVAGTIPVGSSDSLFVIDYKAAQTLEVTVPEGLLNQADEIVR